VRPIVTHKEADVVDRGIGSRRAQRLAGGLPHGLGNEVTSVLILVESFHPVE